MRDAQKIVRLETRIEEEKAKLAKSQTGCKTLRLERDNWKEQYHTYRTFLTALIVAKGVGGNYVRISKDGLQRFAASYMIDVTDEEDFVKLKAHEYRKVEHVITAEEAARKAGERQVSRRVDASADSDVSELQAFKESDMADRLAGRSMPPVSSGVGPEDRKNADGRPS